MFECSWGELSIVALVGLLVLGPEDMAMVVRQVKGAVAKIKAMGQEFTASVVEIGDISDLKKEAQKLNEDMRIIIDLEGNPQPTYDLSDVMGEINAHKKSASVKEDSSVES